MKIRLILSSALLAAWGLIVGGCETTPASAPPITATFLRAGGRLQADAPTLTEGRRLFLNRCIQCHSLPRVAKYDPDRLTTILTKMAARANLNEEQHNAVLKYVLTVRSQ